MLEIEGHVDSAIHRLGIGVFDGYHLGHQKVIEACDKVLSFHPHPDIVLNKDSQLRYLSSKNERKLLIPNILFARFDTPFSQLSATEFLDAINATLKPKIITFGFRFSLRIEPRLVNEKNAGDDVNCRVGVGLHHPLVPQIIPRPRIGTSTSTT